MKNFSATGSLARSVILLSLLAAVLLGVSCATSPLGRKQLMLLPEGQVDQMGVQSFDQMKAQEPVDHDPGVNAYVDCVAAAITQAARGQTDTQKWEVVVFKKDDTINAFALPGGKIGVYTGIFKVARNGAELATVLGHEVGHVIARHGDERVSQQLVEQGGLSLAGAFLAGGAPTATDQLLMAALGTGVQIGVALPFSRTQEAEADLIGEKLMAEAGFDPRASISLWKNMTAAAQAQPPQWLSDHPANENRIADLEKNLPAAEQLYQEARARGISPRVSSASASSWSKGGGSC